MTHPAALPAPRRPSQTPQALLPQLLMAAFTLVLLGWLLWAVTRGMAAQGITLDFGIFARPDSSAGVSHGALMLQGLALTLGLAVGGTLLALLIGVPVGLAQLSANPASARLASHYVGALRNTPLLIVILACNFALLPLLPGGLREWLYNHKAEVWATVFALGVYTSAFIAEAVRSGVAGVPRGQVEAARAAGLGETDVTRLVVLPQAVAAIIPPAGSVIMNLTKNSSLASQIGVTELFFRGAELQSTTFHGFEAIGGVALGYLLLSTLIVVLTRVAEARVTRYRRGR